MCISSCRHASKFHKFAKRAEVQCMHVHVHVHMALVPRGKTLTCSMAASNSSVVLLDGGLATELEHRGFAIQVQVT